MSQPAVKWEAFDRNGSRQWRPCFVDKWAPYFGNRGRLVGDGAYIVWTDMGIAPSWASSGGWVQERDIRVRIVLCEACGERPAGRDGICEAGRAEGRCRACGTEIEPGDRYTERDGELAHEPCPFTAPLGEGEAEAIEEDSDVNF